MNVFLELTLEECRNINSSYVDRTPKSLVDQFPERKKKKMAIDSFREKQTRKGVQLYPEGR